MFNRRLKRAYFYGILLAALSITFLGWWLGSGSHELAIPGERLIAIGRLFGLLATVSILLEVFLMSRIPFMERTFDLHEYVDLHRLTGYAILVAICGHIAFLVPGYAAPSQAGLWHQFFQLNTGYEDVLKASIGTIIFFGATGLSVKLVRNRMRYEWWYVTHLLMYGAILLTFLHQLNTGGDFINQQWFTAFWYALYLGVFGLLGYYRFLQQAVIWHKHRFAVDHIVRESNAVFSVYIRGNNVADYAYEPGQYATWRFLAVNSWWEAHPYSFSSVPGSNWLRLSVRVDGGDFARKLIDLPSGTPVLVDGPRGAFTADRATQDNVVLVAGGIGIGPYMSTIDGLLATGKKVTLLYTVHQHGDLAFGSELRPLVDRGLTVRPYVTQTGNRLNPQTVDAFGKDASIYLCGPERLTMPFKRQLQALGHSPKHIITEEFAY